MEHVERQDERESELRGELDELEKKGDSLEQDGRELDESVKETREEYERGVESSEVPGLQDLDENVAGPPGGSAGQAVEEEGDES